MRVNMNSILRKTDETVKFFFSEDGVDRFGVQTGISSESVDIIVTVLETKESEVLFNSNKNETLQNNNFSVYIREDRCKKEYKFIGSKMEWRGNIYTVFSEKHRDRSYSSHRVLGAVIYDN